MSAMISKYFDFWIDKTAFCSTKPCTLTKVALYGCSHKPHNCFAFCEFVYIINTSYGQHSGHLHLVPSFSV